MLSLKDEISTEKQKELRKQLLEAIKNNPISLQQLSKELGITMVTLRKFIVKGLDLHDYVPIFKIANYVKKQSGIEKSNK